MKSLKDTNKEYLISAGIGLLGMVLSILIGILSGNNISTVIFRSVISVILLSLICFACIYVIKKYVPEIYEAINSARNSENSVVDVEDSAGKAVNKGENADRENANNTYPEESASSIPDMTAAVNREDSKLEREFTDIEKQAENQSSINDNIPGKKSGDFFRDRKINYEPKIAAQAIRTMMKRDE